MCMTHVRAGTATSLRRHHRPALAVTTAPTATKRGPVAAAPPTGGSPQHAMATAGPLGALSVIGMVPRAPLASGTSPVCCLLLPCTYNTLNNITAATGMDTTAPATHVCSRPHPHPRAAPRPKARARNPLARAQRSAFLQSGAGPRPPPHRTCAGCGAVVVAAVYTFVRHVSETQSM